MQRPFRIACAAGTVALAVGLSRILGLAREMTISHLFPSTATDAFVAAFRVPNLFRDLLVEGALAAAFVPVFSELLAREGRQRAFALARSVLGALFLAAGITALAIVAFPRAYALFVAGGFDGDGLALTGLLGRLMAPFLVTVSLTSVLMGMANVRGRFFVPALAPALFNVGMLAGAWLLAAPLARAGWPGVTGLAVGALAGGLLQLGLLGGTLRGWGFGPGPMLGWTEPAFRRVLFRLAPSAFAVAATYVNVIVDTQVASHYGTGPVSWLFFAMRLWMLPVGLIGVGLATAQLTEASRAVAAQDRAALRHALGQSVRSGLLLVVPAATALVVLARPLVRVIYQHGEFGPEAASATSVVLALYAIGLPGYVLVKVFVPTFYALGDAWTPVRLAAWALAAKLALNAILVPFLGWQGLALATGLAALLQAGLSAWALGVRVGGWRGLAGGRALATAGLASMLMAGAVAIAGRGAGLLAAGEGWGATALRLAVAIAAGLAVVAAVTLVSGLPEGIAIGRLMRRLAGSRGTE